MSSATILNDERFRWLLDMRATQPGLDLLLLGEFDDKVVFASMYYLNVMAGPERAWLICTDPDHEWLLEAWSTMDVDPRLPMNKEDAT
ncbi:MAG TPA: 5-deoxy-glucuronate isomerase [Euzebya sp.]|nr:5-deoxy-glucuronate isomerase [Euzebya sp.]